MHYQRVFIDKTQKTSLEIPSLPGNEGYQTIPAKRTINQPPFMGGLHYTRRSRIFNQYYPNPPFHVARINYINDPYPLSEWQTKDERRTQPPGMHRNTWKIIYEAQQARSKKPKYEQLKLF